MSKPSNTHLTILAVGLAIIGWRAFGIAQKYFPAATQAQGLPLSEQAVVADAPVKTVAPDHGQLQAARLEAQKAVEARPWGRDPFDPTAFVEQSKSSVPVVEIKTGAIAPLPPTLKLTGVSRTGSRWLAAVDGTIVGVGDVVQDKYRVARITNSSLTLVSEGWAFCFDLGEKAGQVRPWTENP